MKMILPKARKPFASTATLILRRFLRKNLNPLNMMHVSKPCDSGNINADEKLLHLLHEVILGHPK